MIEPLHRITNFWSWLPAFQAVAETEHLPTAAKRLHVTASALSRSIRLLEADVGQPLFRRTGRRIELNEAGQRFLAAVRDAMRLVHEGLKQIHSQQLDGPIWIASTGLLTTTYVIPALRALRREHPTLVPHITSAGPADVAPRLMRGELDVAFMSYALTDARLSVVDLGHETSAVYCGPGHDLYRRRRPSLEEILACEFVAPIPDAQGDTHEGWPRSVARRVGMHVDQMRVGVDVCASGDLLAVLPDALARSYGDGKVLRRLPIAADLIAPTHMFAMHRPTLGAPERAEAIVAAVSALR